MRIKIIVFIGWAHYKSWYARMFLWFSRRTHWGHRCRSTHPLCSCPRPSRLLAWLSLNCSSCSSWPLSGFQWPLSRTYRSIQRNHLSSLCLYRRNASSDSYLLGQISSLSQSWFSRDRFLVSGRRTGWVRDLHHHRQYSSDIAGIGLCHRSSSSKICSLWTSYVFCRGW